VPQLLTNINASENAELIAAFDKVTADTAAADVAAKLVEFEDDSDAVIALTEAMAKIVTAEDYKGISKASSKEADTAKGHNYVISGIQEGYYLVIEDTSATASSTSYSRMILRVVGETSTTAVIKNNDTPEVSKVIKDSTLKDENGVAYSRFDTASFDETKTFVLSSKVPNMTGYEKYYFVFNDTMSKGIDFEEIKSVKIYHKDDQGAEVTADTITLYEKGKLPEGTSATYPYTYQLEATVDGKALPDNYSTTSHNETKLEIIFNNFIQYKDKYNWIVEIEYTGHLNKDAIVGDPSTYTSGDDTVNNAEGNPNTVSLTYSNNPNVVDEGTTGENPNPDKPSGDSPVKTTEERTVYLYSASLDLVKIDGVNGHRLTGATFKIEGSRLQSVLTTSYTYTAVAFATGTTVPEGTTYYLEQDDNAFTTYSNYTIIPASYPRENIKYKYTGEDPIDLTTATADKFTPAIDGGYYQRKGDLAEGETRFVAITEGLTGTFEQDNVFYTRTESTEMKTSDAEKVSYEVTVGENGLVELDGLGAGEYTITEIKAPDGYNLLSNPITLTVGFQAPATTSTTNLGKWTFTAKVGTAAMTEATGTMTGGELRIVNKQGSSLPTTGGIGTTIFYVLGTALVLAAGLMLVTRKRMRNAA
jgi:fimbrial isopeptide formation D2 family protein/LPXTG-motif cell wall-anchored protein